jgi:endogenous inhibitor of DNA gyrase (YacG/DUF329 family)
MAKCPSCGKEAKPRAENPVFPFCSPRCRQVDLGRWLNEEYRIPVEDSPPTDESQSKKES